ncbi:MAG: hypothetical protein HYT49_03740 [Candidatus Wildermuthbacteria bacterium]|nr:hypothetical protein [Candidatus Wildermuthbacteria bacterium]
MKQIINNLQGWVIDPFGAKWTFVFVFSIFSLSVLADFASTYYFLFLTDCEGDVLKCEANVVVQLIFSKFTFLGGSLLIFSAEIVCIFAVGIPLLYRTTPRVAKTIIHRVAIISLPSITFYFCLTALENATLIPYTFLPISGFLFRRDDPSTRLLLLETGAFLAVPLLVYLLGFLAFRALSILLAKATGVRAKSPLNT